MKPLFLEDNKVFERMVKEAVENIPELFIQHMTNLEIKIEDDNEQNLLGVFEGIPLIDRYNDQSYMPDVITIYEKPLIEISNSIEELKVNIRETVLHEVAHYFGIDDGDLEKMGRY
ncbi:MAG: metallopeptidase family protein [Dehalococcoidia bacterium]|nr:metallopeptidase family protein [Dehalococcoidia bacterium]MDP7613275.1 metallopeptidase family protein [Dehalococcoidia bacterium]